MALRSFSYPTGPTVEMLVEKTGFGNFEHDVGRLQ
jgi:hypothetical protein